MATVTVDLYATAPPSVASSAKSSGVFSAVGDALGAGWHALYAVVRGLLVALAAVGPLAVVILPPAWLANRLRLRRKGAGAGPKAAAARVPSPVAEGGVGQEEGSSR